MVIGMKKVTDIWVLERPDPKRYSDEQLLAGAKILAKEKAGAFFTSAEYRTWNKKRGNKFPNSGAVQKRFGSWAEALKKCGIKEVRHRKDVSTDELYTALEAAWLELEHCPSQSELKKYLKHHVVGFDVSLYLRRIGSYRFACSQLIEFKKEKITRRELLSAVAPTKKKREPISPGTRFQVLKRDKYRCQSCGKTKAEKQLHVDHIVPVAKGGKSEINNLQALCQDCNLGKGTKSFTD
jgi:hypothetical protein